MARCWESRHGPLSSANDARVGLRETVCGGLPAKVDWQIDWHATGRGDPAIPLPAPGYCPGVVGRVGAWRGSVVLGPGQQPAGATQITEYALLSAGSRATRARATAAAPLAEGARRYVRPGAGTSGAVEATVRSLPAGLSARTIAAVTYDEDLAARIRELVGGEETLTEQKMFGGLALLIRGNMAVSASGQGGLMVRVDPAKSDELVATTPARPVEMRGRSTRGWLRVRTEDLRTKRELAKWVALGTTCARSLPAKR